MSFTVDYPNVAPALVPISYYTWAGTLPDQGILNGETPAIVGYCQYLYISSPRIGGSGDGETYRCSALSNGGLYACVSVPSSSLFPDSFSFSNGYVYMGLGGIVGSDFISRNVQSCQVNLNTGVFSNCSARIDLVIDPSSPIRSTVGIGSMAVSNNTLYFYAFLLHSLESELGLWVCPVSDGVFNFSQCAKSSVANSLFMTQVASTSLAGLNQCLLASDGSVISCQNTNASSPLFNWMAYTNGLLVANNYIYGAINTQASVVCPFNNAVVGSDACSSVSGIAFNQIRAIGYLNGWVYTSVPRVISPILVGQKSSQGTDRQLVNTGNAISL